MADLPKKNFVFRPNHTYVFATAQVSEDIQFIIHIDVNPIFFELQWDPLPGLSIKVGKLLVPFGKHICTGQRPKCSVCPVVEYCRQVGVTEHR